jgi:cell fate (sporulation/competence/biofilm development) regulator YmcA (YheA/YmcA/DUF963 family)
MKLQTLTWNNVLTEHDVNGAFNNFWETFSGFFNLQFPLKTVKFNKNVHRKNNFMTKGILISRSKKMELQKKAILYPDIFSTEFKNYRNLYNKIVKCSKKLSLESDFKKYKNNPKKTWDLLKETALGVNNSKINSIDEILDNGKLLTNNTEMANTFNEFFTSVGKKISDNIPATNIDPSSTITDLDENIRKFEFENIGPVWITDIVKKFANKSSPDLDGISLKFLKKIIDYIALPLSHIFTLSVSNGVFPEKLKECRIVPIFKGGDYKLCDNYRPISLVNTISKILEKVVAIKLTNYLQINKLLYEHQYGFQRGLSTEHNLTHVVNYIGNALNEGNYCIGIFLDLKKAFDVCSHSVLLSKLKKLGIMGRALDWFGSYLKNRRQRVDINGTYSFESTLNISVLQGTTLGPILFLCYINDLYTCTNLKLFMFADDTSCLTEGKNLNQLTNFVNVELQKISNWFTVNKMALNIAKTKYIIFRTPGKQIPVDLNPIVINSNMADEKQNPTKIQELIRVHNDAANDDDKFYKLLGVYFDEFLTFNKHVEILCAKLTRANFCLRRASSSLPLNLLKNLYHSLFHPHILYCLNITCCTSKSNLNRIKILQKKAIRIISKAKSNSHTNPLFLQNCILPLDEQISKSKINAFYSL